MLNFQIGARAREPFLKFGHFDHGEDLSFLYPVAFIDRDSFQIASDLCVESRLVEADQISRQSDRTDDVAALRTNYHNRAARFVLRIAMRMRTSSHRR